MAKLKVGDPVLIKGPAHLEKALVEKVEKGFYLLDNQLKINQDLKIEGLSKGSQLKVMPFDEAEYQYGISLMKISRYLSEIKDNYKFIKDKEKVVKIAEKLEKIKLKYINNR